MAYDFDMIWKNFNTSLKAYIQRRISNTSDAEDILQNIYLKIYGNLQNLSKEDKIHAWVFTITKNEIHDYYRNRKRSGACVELYEDIPVEEPKDATDNKIIAECIRGMLEYLPDIYKEAIILTEFLNYSQKELAVQLGLSVSGAKSRVQRGREKLKKLLTDCCSFETDTRGNIIDYKKRDKCDSCYKC